MRRLLNYCLRHASWAWGHMYLTPFLKRQREMSCHKFKTDMSYTKGVLCWVSR